MRPKISAEQRAALEDGPGRILVEDSETGRKYFLIEASYFESMLARANLESLERGISDAEADRVHSLDEVRKEMSAWAAKRSAP